MYAILIALYLAYTCRSFVKKLLAVEGGFAAFSRINWVMFVMCILMVPLAIAVFIKGWRSVKEDEAAKKREEAEKAEREIEAVKEKFDLDLPEDVQSRIQENSGGSIFDE